MTPLIIFCKCKQFQRPPQEPRSATMLVMLVLTFFSWWYGRGWLHVAGSYRRRLASVMASFSVRQLLQTLFAPWRRIITYPGASLGDRFRAWGDNIFSRAIGFVVRLVVLLCAGVIALLVILATTAEVLVWPVLPALGPVLIVLGIAS